MLQTKLSIAPYFLAVASGVLLWRRDLMRQRALWLAAAGALLGLLPWLAWNAAHGWSGVRWITQHATQGAILASSRLGMLYHAFVYLTPPIVLAVLAGLAAARHPRGRWLAWIALWLLAPVLLGPADSPRNLLAGMIPLLCLSGGLVAMDHHRARLWGMPVLFGLLAVAMLYGLGTVLSITEGYRWPENGMGQAIRRDAAGRRSLAAQLRAEEQPILTIDYSLAGQLSFYVGKPVYSTWEQFRIWGIPDLNRATIVSLDYVPPASIETQLRGAYSKLWGPQDQEIGEGSASTRVHVWRVHDLAISQEELLDHLDFLTLYRADRAVGSP